MLSILLLGPPQILRDGQPLSTLRRKNRALLFCLARRPAPLSREEALVFLWPDSSRPDAQRSLRTMLSELRRALGPALLAEPESLAFAAETEVDVRRFEASLAAPNASLPALSAALELYRGDFIQGFSLADPPEFDDWVARQREDLRAQAITGLARLAALHEQARDPAAALAALNRALAFDPLREDLQRAALRLHQRLGERAAAIRRYEALRRQLDDELGVLPSPETRALYADMINDRLAPVEAAPPAPVAEPGAVLARPAHWLTPAPLLPFTGRAAELSQIQAAVERGQLVVVEGEPGLGKTRLVEEFASLPEQAGRLVLRGAAHESEQGLPYQPIVDALRGLLSLPDWPALRPNPAAAPGWLAEAARLLPELLAAEGAPGALAAVPAAEEALVWDGLSQLLQSLAHRRPLLMLLDDLHWADAASVGLLGYLARRAAAPGLALLATARPAPPESPLGRLLPALAHERRLARLRPAPLTMDDTRQVAARLSPAPDDAARLAGWLRDHAEGNPYFLTELVRFAQQGGLLRADGTLDEALLAATPVLPATVENLIGSRLARLAPEARRALEVAAVAGREFDFELVQAVTGQDETAALDALDALLAAGLIQPRAGGQYAYAFDHSLTMEVVSRDMGAPRFRVLHRRLAEVLAALPAARQAAAAGTIAYHFARAGLPERAGPFAWQAGQRSAALAAWAPALAFYQQALQASPSPAEALALRLAMGEARFHSGDFAAATDDYQAAIPLAQALNDLDSLEAIYIALNLSLLPQSRYAEAIALGQDLRRTGPPELAACAEFIWATGLALKSTNPGEAEYHVREAARLLAEQPPGASRLSQAQIKYQLAGIVGQQGRAAESAALYREALHLTQHAGQSLDLIRQIMLLNNLAYQLSLLGELEPASQYAQAGIQLAQERGSLTHLSYLLSTSGEIALARGDVNAAEQFFTDGLALARQVPIAERIAGHTANLGLVATRRGQFELARDRLREALVLADSLGASHLAVRIRIWLAPLAPPEEAARLLQDARAVAEGAGYSGLLAEISRLEHV